MGLKYRCTWVIPGLMVWADTMSGILVVSHCDLISRSSDFSNGTSQTLLHEFALYLG